jgi:hypothetical protein
VSPVGRINGRHSRSPSLFSGIVARIHVDSIEAIVAHHYLLVHSCGERAKRYRKMGLKPWNQSRSGNVYDADWGSVTLSVSRGDVTGTSTLLKLSSKSVECGRSVPPAPHQAGPGLCHGGW